MIQVFFRLLVVVLLFGISNCSWLLMPDSGDGGVVFDALEEWQNAFSNLTEKEKRRALEKSLRVNPSHEERDYEGKTPLYYAVSTNNYFAVKALLENGADPMAVSLMQRPSTPIHAAVARSDMKIVKLMMLYLYRNNPSQKTIDPITKKSLIEVAIEYKRGALINELR